MTLGLAIRASQSIGLHMEGDETLGKPTNGFIDQELRRRMWHSAYALDRLLSLQLGRQPAIRNRDCSVRLPSRIDDMDFDLSLDVVPHHNLNESRPGDYFVAVIKFSRVVGHVLRNLYGPSSTYSEEMLTAIDYLDTELLNWKAQLPRWLRFDRGHLFEGSSLYKRQRNMLGIKFHHLRALIHRPCLCLPWLQRNQTDIRFLVETQSQRIVRSERICVKEAQDMARMLHDIPDKRTLVEDFPWWQMISCLICASSILLVMRSFSTSNTPEEHVQRETLEEDADTCLGVFGALSANSDAARIARDMLQDLRASEFQDENSILRTSSHGRTLPQRSVSQSRQLSNLEESVEERTDVSQNITRETILPYSMQNDLLSQWNNQEWPSEMANSMAWSSQFLNVLHPHS